MKPFDIENVELLRVTIGDVLSPELLRPDWRKKSVGEDRTFGHCYIAAEAFYQETKGKIAYQYILKRKKTKADYEERVEVSLADFFV